MGFVYGESALSSLGLTRAGNMVDLASDRLRTGGRMRWERAPVAFDERWDFGKAQVVSLASDCWRDGKGANRDCRRDRHGRAHEVSHQNRDVLARGHSPPWGRSAMVLDRKSVV